MNKFKLLKFWPAFAILSLILIFSSCKKDDVDDRDSFIGSYAVKESWVVNTTTFEDSYSITISRSEKDSKMILISNFAKFGTSRFVTAEINGTTFTIPQQTVEGTGFSGSGSINGSTLSFSYQQSETGKAVWNVSASGTKM